MKKPLLVLLGSIALTSAAFAGDTAKSDCDSCCKDCASCCETTSGAAAEKKSDAAKQTSDAKTAEKTTKLKVAKKG